MKQVLCLRGLFFTVFFCLSFLIEGESKASTFDPENGNEPSKALSAGAPSKTVISYEDEAPPKPLVPRVSALECGSRSLSFYGRPPTGVQWYWQNSAEGISTENGDSPLLVSESGTYYLRARNQNGQWSAAVTVEVEVFPSLQAGQVFDQEFCLGAQPDVFGTTPASGGDGNYSYEWEGSEDGANWETVRGAHQATFTPKVSSPYHYYRRKVQSLNCEATTEAAVLLGFDQPLRPTMTGDTLCGRGFAYLKATGLPEAEYKWYDRPIGGNMLKMGSSFTPYVDQAKSFYVTASVEGCDGPMTEVQVVFEPSEGSCTRTLEAVASGDWSNPLNWSQALLPDEFDVVIVDQKELAVSTKEMIAGLVLKGSASQRALVRAEQGGDLKIRGGLQVAHGQAARLEAAPGGSITIDPEESVDNRTKFAIRDGDWHDPSTWYSGKVPTASNLVLINGLSVSIAKEAACKTLVLLGEANARGRLLMNAGGNLKIHGKLVMDKGQNVQLEVKHNAVVELVR